MQAKHRVIVIGFDGATFNIIKPMLKKGKLPSFAKMMQIGVHGNLKSTIPPTSAPAWTSFMTGVNPGKHGVFDFVDHKNSSIKELKIVDSRLIQQKTIWELLGEKGLKCGVVNIPITFPAKKINGFMITGMLSRGSEHTCYPKNFIEEIEEFLGEKYIFDFEQICEKGQEKEFYSKLEKMHELREKVLFFLLKEKKVDFLAINFSSTDRASHFLWDATDENGEGYVEKIYERMDKTLGKVLKYRDEHTSIIVMSDHGFGAQKGIININNYLLEKGYIKFNSRGRIKWFLFSHGLTPKNIYQLLKITKTIGLLNIIPKAAKINLMSSFISLKDLDTDNTIAVSSGYAGFLKINRETLAKKNLDFNTVKKKLIQDITNKEHGLGKLIGKIWEREQIYKGKMAVFAPELFIESKDHQVNFGSTFSYSKNLVENPIALRRGKHEMNGIFIATGPEFKKNLEVKQLSIMDIFPIVLKLFELKSPKGIDGKIPIGIFSNHQKTQPNEVVSPKPVA